MHKKNIIILLLVISSFLGANGQESRELVTGKVSYITGQNIYVKFATTEKIHVGDTVFRHSGDQLVPLFVVENISSVSCVGKPVDKSDVKVDDEIAVRVVVKPPAGKPKPDQAVIPKVISDSGKLSADSKQKQVPQKSKQNINGSLSAYSYSNLSNTAIADSYRMRYTLSLRANNLANSGFSAETYISFSHKLKDWAEVKANVFSALKIYSLAVKYDLGAKTSISAGRKINVNLSNIGAVDGLQAETRLGQFTLGAVAGSRPNDLDYGFNPKLLEYGGFLGHAISTKTGRMQTSAAFFEQRNTGVTDRRFAYFQHDNSLLKNLYLFTSCELDLYKVVEGVAKNQASITSLYFSLRYRPFKQLSLFASYDARKNVIYYETYKSFADRLLDEATRQGLQLRVNYRIGTQVNVGVNGGYRFMTKDVNPNENLNGFICINQLPWIKATATLTANFLKTSYLNGAIYEVRLSRDILKGKLYTDINYRLVDYSFLNGGSTLIQHIAQANLSWQFKNKMSFSVDYELTIEKISKYHRIYISFSQRF